MINPRLYRWPDLSKATGLLLFAQRVQECLFDYTLDSYKAPALNTHTRCKELLQALDDIEVGTLVRASVEPIVAELAHSIRADSGAKALLGVHAPIFGDPKAWSTADLRTLRIQAETARSHLAKGAYERELIKQLKAALPTGKEKEEILALTTALVVEWMGVGFSRDYIYSQAKGFFFGVGGSEFRDANSFDTFLMAFADRQPKKYQVCVRLSRAWGDLDLNLDLPKEVMEVSDTAPPHRRGLRLEKAFLAQKHDGIYGVMTVEALDPK